MRDDLISRSALIEKLRGNVMVEVTPDLEKAIEDQPAAYDESAKEDVEMGKKDWIPVEERLPGSNVDILVSVQNIEDGGHVYISVDCILDELDGPFWGTHHRATERVLAWMPLPPVYGMQHKDDPLEQIGPTRLEDRVWGFR